MKRISLASLLAVMMILVFSASAYAAVPDFQTLGFPTVAAEQTIEAGKAATITYGNVQIKIPEGAFKNQVKFQVIEGPLADFQKKAPTGETVLMDFAFKATDMTTNSLIGKFEKPVLFSYTDANINMNSKYYDTAVDGTFTENKIPAKIEGTTLSHPIAGAGVGWAVTSPAAAVKHATSPVTGLPTVTLLSIGALLLAVGGAFLIVSRRRTN